jgi:hypothetical protein
MKLKFISLAAVITVAAVSVTVALASTRSSSSPQTSRRSSMAGMSMATRSKGAALTESDLRALLGQQFGEHAVLAMNATDAGVTGARDFPAIAKALDANSVAISKSIGSIYGAKAASTFLNGKDMWRDHIRFFVAYTQALAKHDKGGEARAVANLQAYVRTFGTFLATAVGLPPQEVQSDLLGHVFGLKAQLDDYAAGNYAKAAQDYTGAYDHMFMTADIIAGAIAKQKHLAP